MDAAAALIYSELSSTFDLALGYKITTEEIPARASSTTSFTTDSTASDVIQLNSSQQPLGCSSVHSNDTATLLPLRGATRVREIPCEESQGGRGPSARNPLPGSTEAGCSHDQESNSTETQQPAGPLLDLMTLQGQPALHSVLGPTHALTYNAADNSYSHCNPADTMQTTNCTSWTIFNLLCQLEERRRSEKLAMRPAAGHSVSPTVMPGSFGDNGSDLCTATFPYQTPLREGDVLHQQPGDLSPPACSLMLDSLDSCRLGELSLLRGALGRTPPSEEMTGSIRPQASQCPDSSREEEAASQQGSPALAEQPASWRSLSDKAASRGGDIPKKRKFSTRRPSSTAKQRRRISRTCSQLNVVGSTAMGSTAIKDNTGLQQPSTGADQAPQTPVQGASSPLESSGLLQERHPHQLAAEQIGGLADTVAIAAASPPAVDLMQKIGGSRGFGSKASPCRRSTCVGPLSVDLQPRSITRHSSEIVWTKPEVVSAEPSPESHGIGGDLDNRMDSLLERCQALVASSASTSALDIIPGDQALALGSDVFWDQDNDPLLTQHGKAASMANAGSALRVATKRGPSCKEAAFHFIEMASMPPHALKSKEAGRRKKRRGRLLVREEKEGEGANVALPALEALFGLTIQEATVHLGVGLTTLKKICRKHNITRWPQRQRSRLDGLVNKVDGSMSEKLGIHKGRTKGESGSHEG